MSAPTGANKPNGREQNAGRTRSCAPTIRVVKCLQSFEHVEASGWVVRRAKRGQVGREILSTIRWLDSNEQLSGWAKSNSAASDVSCKSNSYFDSYFLCRIGRLQDRREGITRRKMGGGRHRGTHAQTAACRIRSSGNNRYLRGTGNSKQETALLKSWLVAYPGLFNRPLSAFRSPP